MSSIDSRELFEQYYQSEYDFNTASLSQEEIAEIKVLAREKRVDYGLAPMGTNVFDWIRKQNSDIRFELVPFESEKIDGMLYIPTTGKERAYIVLNANKPLINQIFTAVHEFYHYLKDYQKFKDNPYVCDFSMLKDVNEKKASRFAAEVLLPEDALLHEVRSYLPKMIHRNIKEKDFVQYAALTLYLTMKYQMPLKAVIYRLAEEGYLDKVNKCIENYEFIKKILQEIKIYDKYVEELYSKENVYVFPCSSIYHDMEKAFSTGNATKESILEDAEKLGLDMDIINEFLDADNGTEAEDEEDDDELFAIINARR